MIPYAQRIEHIGARVRYNVPVSIYDLAALMLWVVSVEG